MATRPDTASVDIGNLIESRPDRYGGWPLIAGTGFPVAEIAIYHNEGFSIDEIAERQTQLSLAQIYAAMAYYYANKELIDRQIEEDEAAFEHDRAEAERRQAAFSTRS